LPVAREDQEYMVSIAASASDADSDSITFSITDGPTWLEITDDGTLSGEPGFDDIGSGTVTIRVTDFFGTYAETTVGLTVASKADLGGQALVNMVDFAIFAGSYGVDRNLALENAGFENPGFGDGVSFPFAPYEWVMTGVTKLYDPAVSQWANLYEAGQQVPEGEQIVECISNGGIDHSTAHIIADNTQYDFSVDTGMPLTATTANVRLKIIAVDGGSETVVANVIYDENTLENGKWKTVNVEWTNGTQHTGSTIKVFVGGANVHVDNAKLFVGNAADLDGDGDVDMADLAILAQRWLM
jgi:hypothetical protein